MNATVAERLVTTEELLAMPDDGTERWLIRGQLRESPMTVRNRFHSQLTARISQLIGQWLDAQPEPRGEVFSGEAGCRLSRDPDTTVGIDVVYFDAETLDAQPEDTTLLEGIPKLAVEVLSPSDTVENINEKVDTYLAHRVPLVWLVDPHNRTIRVHRPDAEPDMFNVTQEISGEPVMPGFRVAVARIFGR